jgi:hypothetical protein
VTVVIPSRVVVGFSTPGFSIAGTEKRGYVMTIENLVGLLIAAALIGYLFLSTRRPKKF